MIGTAEEAALVPTMDANTLPPGWELAGTGCSRIAFRSPSGVVYKRTWFPDDYANLAEYVVAQRLAAMVPPNGWGTVQANLFLLDGSGPILAMEDFGNEEAYVFGDDATNARTFFGVYDPHGGNIRERDGLYYCIDLGFSRLASDVIEIFNDVQAEA